MDRDIGTTVKLITLVSVFGHSILATQRHVRALGHFVLYYVFQLGCVGHIRISVYGTAYGIIITVS